jgi:hypothetical protein
MTRSKPNPKSATVSATACESTRSAADVRACSVCGTPGPAEGPLPHAWDCHLVVVGVKGSGGAVTEMQMSCSAKCRAARGWRERKGVA